MSWSIHFVGNKNAVAAACAAELDNWAKKYEGQEEAKDVLAAKDRVLAAIAAIDTTPDSFGASYGVQVTASGSAGSWSMSLQLGVTKVTLVLDAQAPAPEAAPPAAA